ncbi:transcription termination/antitermination protein NusG [Candidatus Avelusimicrobium sp.]
MSEEKNWYVVHTQTGHEDKVREKINLQIEVQGFADRVFKVLVPTEEVVEVKQNKKILRKRKFFPGYVLVQMNLTSESYWFIKGVSGVTGFLGDPNPVPLPEEEIAGIVELTEEGGKPKHVISFERGESVRITEGPFKHFIGKVEEVNEQKNKLKVMVTVFDRATPVEVDFLQVEKN